MGGHVLTIALLLCQLLIYNRSGFVAAEELAWDYKVPISNAVSCLGLLDRFNQPALIEDNRQEVIDRLMSYFQWPSPSTEVARMGRATMFDQPVYAEDNRQEVINRLMSYFNWRPSCIKEDNCPVITEGIGEVFVQGDDICTDGITEVEGTVPVGGNVVFGGAVRASGTVTIAGRCAPACGFSPLRIGQPLLPGPQPLLLPPPVKSPVTEISLPEFIPSLTYEIVPLSELAPLPSVSLSSVVFPAVVIPAYIIPEVVLQPSEFYELDAGCGSIVLSGNDIIINGIPYVDESSIVW